eukprot:1151699-Pelagomonas_calceolata.AAC.3
MRKVVLTVVDFCSFLLCNSSQTLECMAQPADKWHSVKEMHSILVIETLWKRKLMNLPCADALFLNNWRGCLYAEYRDSGRKLYKSKLSVALLC